MNDRTKEFLLARRSLAEKATPGPWEKKQKRFFGDDEETPYVAVENRIILYPGQRGGAEAENTASFCAANSPDVVMADIDEILRLRSLVEQHEDFIGNMGNDAEFIERKIAELAEFLDIEHEKGNMLTLDSIKAEVKKLKENLDFANKVATEQHEVAKLAWGGEIPSPLPGHRRMTEDEVAAMFEHLNCPWYGESGHVGDCEEADQQVKARLELLEKEADWLALVLANVECGVPVSEYIDMDINGMSPPAPEHWRAAARKNVKTGK